MDSLKVTVLTVSFNAAKTIEQTIVSVICQDYPNIEYIVVDGNSTDGTVEIIKKYERFGVKWISEPDEGIYDAMNKGVHMATGDYVEIIGADDALTDSNTISRVVSQLNEDVDILSGQVWFVDEKTKRQSIYANTNMRDRQKYRGGMAPHAAMFVKRELLLRYPFDKKYRISADYKFFLQCYYDKRARIKYVNDRVAFFSAYGVSSNDCLCWKEDNCIHRELGLPFCAPHYTTSSQIKRALKKALVLMRVFIPAKKVWTYFNRHFVWKKHTCNNKICRWCGRMGKG